MKKRILSFVAVMILTLSVCMTAFAEGETSVTPPVQEHTGTAAGLKSYGRIVYQKGTESVKIDSDDLYMLADQIDQVKLQVTDQLEAMNTYFTAGEGEIALETSDDISVVHAKPFEEDFVDPVDVNFDTLLEGIAVSQSVSTDTAAYGYPAGTELYKDEKGVLTTNGSGAGTEKITVTAATADNLSAGTAAWVDGSLILGTGEDNKSYFDDGVSNSGTRGASLSIYCTEACYPNEIAVRTNIPTFGKRISITVGQQGISFFYQDAKTGTWKRFSGSPGAPNYGYLENTTIFINDPSSGIYASRLGFNGTNGWASYATVTYLE